jgi:hypothetical protein
VIRAGCEVFEAECAVGSGYDFALHLVDRNSRAGKHLTVERVHELAFERGCVLRERWRRRREDQQQRNKNLHGSPVRKVRIADGP